MNYKHIKFQYCPWYIQWWRRRWYAIVPFKFIKFWIEVKYHEWKWLKENEPGPEDLFMDIPLIWTISCGRVQHDYMNWWYTLEEIDREAGPTFHGNKDD